MIGTSRPEEEITYIRKIIEESRASFSEDGKPYIAWGLIVAMGSIASYVEALTQPTISFSGWLWMALSIIGVAYVITYKLRNKDSRRATSLGDKLQGALWGAVGSSIGMVILLVFVTYSRNPSESIHPIFIYPIVSFLLAVAYYMCGTILEIKWLRNIAFAWWAGAIGMYLFFSIHVILVYALMLIVFQVVPGLILYRKYKQSESNGALLTDLA